MRNIKADQALVAQYLASGQLPWRTRELRALGQALPRAAEQWSALQAPEAEVLGQVLLQNFWPVAQTKKDSEVLTGWPTLFAGCLAAAEVLGIALPGADRVGRNDALRTEHKALRPHRIYVLLRGADPTRVLLADSEAIRSAPPPDLSTELCSGLARTLLHYDGSPAWRLQDPAARGESQMAGLLLRIIAEMGLPESLRGRPIGITGELDRSGSLLPVQAITEKVKRFFSKFYDGICFVPAENWAELWKVSPRPFREDVVIEKGVLQPSTRLSDTAWKNLYPVHSITELLIRFGLVFEHVPSTRLFRDLRTESRQLTDWRGTKRRADEIVALPLRDLDPLVQGKQSGSPMLRLDLEKLASLLPRRIGPAGDPAAGRGVVLSGLPGGGKSMVMRRLLYELNAGQSCLDGPAFLINARQLTAGESWAHALVRQLHGRQWDAAQVADILADPGIKGGIWLLLDGLDELPLPRRRQLVSAVQDWPGPFLIATRKLRESENLPGVTQILIDNLDHETQLRILELEERADLVKALKEATEGSSRAVESLLNGAGSSWRERGSDAMSPGQRILLELGATPLGLSLLAVAIKPGQPLPETRASMLHLAIIHLLDRACIEEKITPDERLHFDSNGEHFLGAAAWHMLRDSRATLTRRDVVWARQQLHIDTDEEVRLLKVLDASGFVERIGGDEREFSHKTFAEFCASAFLLEQPDLPQELLPRVGEPGIDEVVIHLCAQAADVALWLRRLVSNAARPLASLALAIRVLTECRIGDATQEIVTEILTRRLRLLSWFPAWDLPGDLGRPGPLWDVLQRFAPRLRPKAEVLVAACHPEVRQWLESPPLFLFEENDYRGQRDYYEPPDFWGSEDERWRLQREIAEQLYTSLRIEVPLDALIRFRCGKDVLRSRGQGAWFVELEPSLCSQEHEVRLAAEDVWLIAAPLSRRMELLSRLRDYRHGWSPQHAAEHEEIILKDVLRQGSLLQQREALLRIAVSTVSFRIDSESSRDLMDARLWAQGGEVLTAVPLRSEQWLELWDWAWRSGVVGQNGSAALEAVYERFLHDENETARWRAVVAMSNLCGQQRSRADGAKDSATAIEERQRLQLEERRRRLAAARGMLGDPHVAVRVAALKFLAAEDKDFSLYDVLPFCAAGDASERWVAVEIGIQRGLRPPLDYMLDVLSDEQWEAHQRRGWEERHSVSNTRAEGALSIMVNAAHGELINWTKNRYKGAEHRGILYEQLDQPRFNAAAKELLEEPYRQKWPILELSGLLHGARPAQRRWVAETLARQHDDQDRQDLLLSLLGDADPKVAAPAAELLQEMKRAAERLKTQRAESEAPRRIAVSEIDRSVVKSYGGSRSQVGGAESDSREPFVIGRLASYASFDELWEALREQPIDLTSLKTTDGADTGKLFSHPKHAALLARDSTLRQLLPIANMLRQLYLPQHRTLCLRDLGHPLVGWFAELLLSATPSARDLLPLIGRDEISAIRVARLATGTALAAAVIGEFVATAEAGKLQVPVLDEVVANRASDIHFFAPLWLRRFEDLAGIEGLLLLLNSRLPSATERLIQHCLKHRITTTDQTITAALRDNVLKWARPAATGTGSEEVQCVALQIIGQIGDEHDAGYWATRLMDPAAGLPESMIVEALTVIKRYGTASQAPLLRSFLRHKSSEIAIAALSALSRVGTEQDVETFLLILDRNQLLRQQPSPQYAPELGEVNKARAAALRGTIRLGNRQQARRLAALLIAESNSRVSRNYDHTIRAYTTDAGLRVSEGAQSNQLYVSIVHPDGTDRTYWLPALDKMALTAASRYGRLPEHALLVVDALLHDPGSVDLGGDDIQESTIPHDAQETVNAIVEKTDLGEVRRAFAQCVLWGGPTASIARAELNRLGGPRKQDIPLLLEHLEKQPDSPEALSLLAEFAQTEADVVQLWTRKRCHWWPDTPTPDSQDTK